MMAGRQKVRLGRNDWVLAGLRALVRGGVAAVKVEILARDIATSKGSFYWHFKDLADLHQAMLDFWEALATKAITATVQQSGLDGRAQLMLLVDIVSLQPGPAFGGIEVEPALRDWGRTDARARAVLERVDRQRLDDLSGFLRLAGVAEAQISGKAQLIYAGVIGLENLRMTTGAEMRPALQALVTSLLRDATGL